MGNRSILSTGNSFKDYYQVINRQYLNVFKKYYMLHYPLFKTHGESLEKRQMNLTEFCLSHINGAERKTVLDVGCGNGVQSLHIAKVLNPDKMHAIDINDHNIRLAQGQPNHTIDFRVDDAQELATIPSQSVDILFCVESAFHYPDKKAFIKQIHRVLKPGGLFIIADILSKSYKKRWLIGRWKRKMYYFHWIMQDYLNAFDENNLEVHEIANITPGVVKGYSGYRRWINREQFSTFWKYLVMRSFISIQVWVNVFLLKVRRQYVVYVGKSLPVNQ